MAKNLAVQANPLANGLAHDLLNTRCVHSEQRVNGSKLIAVHHVQSQGRRIPVLLFRNRCGSVAGRCLIDRGDTPIVDGPSPEAVLELLTGVIDELLLARSAIAHPPA